MAKKRKLQHKPEPEPVPVPEPEPSEEEEEEEKEEVSSSEEEEEEEEGEEESSEEEEPSPAPNASGSGSGSGSETTFDEVRALLAPFPKDQLISLLTMAAVTHPSVLRSIQDTADSDKSHRNIFVHGIPWDATTATLHSFFGRFGDVENVFIATDKLTGVSKGYAFVLFKTRAAAQKALDEPNKFIGSKAVAYQLAAFGPPPAAPYSDHNRKIYVANVNAEVDTRKLLDFFSTFGEIEKGPLGMDKVTGRPKGYALFVYRTPEGAKKALESPRKEFMGHLLTCSMALEHPPAVGGPQTVPSTAVPAEGTKTEPRLEKVQKAMNNHFMAPTAMPQAARPVVPHALPAAGLGYTQPISGPAPGPVAKEELSQVVGQAVGQVLTAMGLDRILGGAQAPAANAMVPPGQGGYGAGPHVHGEYGASSHLHLPGGHVAGLQEQGHYGAGMQSVYGAGGPMQGGYGAAPQAQGGYVSPVVGRGGVRAEYLLGGYGGYGNPAGYGGYANPPPYR